MQAFHVHAKITVFSLKFILSLRYKFKSSVLEPLPPQRTETRGKNFLYKLFSDRDEPIKVWAQGRDDNTQ